VAYLKRQVNEHAAGGRSVAEIAGEEGSRAFAHYVLAAFGQADAGGLGRLYEERAQLPIFGRAFLARALVAARRTDLATTLAAELAALVPGGDGPVIVKEGQRDLGWYWSTDVRSTALVLLALLDAAPANPAIRRLSEGLLAAREAGRWSNTEENVYAMLALAQLAKARAAGGDVTVAVAVGGRERARRTLSGGRVERVRVPLAELGAGPLVIEGRDGPAFYTARLKVERPLEGAADDRGLGIERTYLDADTGAPLTRIRLGQTIKVQLVVRSPLQRAHVAVVDRLPAGFEPVLIRFRRSYTGDEEGPRRSFWWSTRVTAWQNEELRDEGARVFADLLAPGESRHEYLVRATTAGTFAAPPASVEAMYEPQVAGRTAAATIVVTR
jgi:uncharacterized protein YfaS (alpha-2-macroglobulin family)